MDLDELCSAIESRFVSRLADAADRYFILKTKTCESIERSQLQGIWATRAHANCAIDDQPHERLARARRTGHGQVVLLFAGHSEHAWIGYAFLADEPRYDAHEEFPHVFAISWQACLPSLQGVDFGSLTTDVHKVFNGDEVDSNIGQVIRKAIDEKVHALKYAEERAYQKLCETAFVHMVPGESEVDLHGRLLCEVESRLGHVVMACLCGSRRYNLHFPESDHDLLLVYAAKNQEAAPAVIKNPSGLAPDYTLIEVRRFVQMLLDGDPRMVESLFLNVDVKDAEGEPCMICTSTVWPSIVRVRTQFLTRALVQKYLGDATGRSGLAAVRKGAKREKHRKILYIAFRTLRNALQACNGEALGVWRPSSSEERAFIMSVRRGGGGSDVELLTQAELLEASVRSALEASALPIDARHATEDAETWLADVAQWQGEG